VTDAVCSIDCGQVANKMQSLSFRSNLVSDTLSLDEVHR